MKTMKLNKELLLSLAFLLNGLSIFAQPTLDWVGSINTGTYEWGRTIKTDSNGDVYVYGQCSSSSNDFELGLGNYSIPSASLHLYVAKYTSAGNVIWVKYFGYNATPYDMEIDNAGNIYLTGKFNSTIDLDPSTTATFNVTANGSNSDIFYSKLDVNGDFLWGLRWGGSSWEEAKSIALDNSGNMYSTGYFYGSFDFNPGATTQTETSANSNEDVFVTKWDANGNYVWGKRIGEINDDYGNSIEVDASGNILIVGQFSSMVDFNPNAGVFNMLASSNDFFILKLDPNANFIWAKKVGGVGGTAYGHDFAVDPLNNIYVVGEIPTVAIDMDPGAGVFNMTSTGGYDAYVLKLDASGGFQWAKQFEGGHHSHLRNIDVDDNGSVFCGGEFVDSVDVDPGVGTTWKYNAGGTGLGAYDAFMVNLSSNGDYLWAQSFGTSSDQDRFMDIHIVNNSTIYSIGHTRNPADLDPGASMVTIQAGAGEDVFVQKLHYCTNTTSSINVTACTSYISPSGNFTWSATGQYQDVIPNANGCDSTITINLTIIDLTAPVANVASLSNVTGSCSVTSLIAPTATDNCAGAITGTHNATLPITFQGTTTVTWTYNDGNGNTSTQTQNVVISDVTAPVANQASLAAIVANCGQSVTSLTAPTASDNCAGTVTGTHNSSLPITSSTTITWTYNDGNGNISTQNQTITINVDNVAPVANVATLSNVTSECSVTSLTAPTATDNCAGVITGTHNATLPITFQGTTTVTWTYNDGNGNTSTQTQNVVISDVTAPVANQASLAAIVANCGQSVTSLTAPTASDNCAGTVTGTHNSSLPITSSTTITWTYNDGNGNISTQNQTITINVDNVAPVANVATLSNVTSECSVTSLTAPTATDNCAGTITGTHNASLPIAAQGTTTITWTYNDGNGNTSTQTQTIVIDDATNPVATLANLTTISSECDVTPVAPTATDNCAGTITGTPDVTFPITASGTTVVTWTYNDGNGNTSTQTQNVVITPIDNGITQNDAITLSADASGYSYQWVDCNNGNQAIAGATNQTFVATVNGNYAVEIDNGTCTVTSACIVIDEVGITEFGDTELIEVFPNPTNGSITIASGVSFNRVEVLNALGQKVSDYEMSETSNYSLTLPEENGVYILKVYSNESQVIKRVVKQ